MSKDNRWCLICQPRNRTLYWHFNREENKVWCFCNKCDRSYNLNDYCRLAGVDVDDFLKGDFHYQEAKPNEVQAIAWPARFLPLADPRSEPGCEYIRSRGLTLNGDMHYDIDRHGIVFPYYFGNHFCGAQTRFIVPKVHDDGVEQKIDTLPGTRLGLLFYGWNQAKFMGNVKGIFVCEGAFNSLSIQQALDQVYGGRLNNPWRSIACSGSGATKHHKESLKELQDQGLKIILSPDFDQAGQKMLEKFKEFDVGTHYAITGDFDKDWNDLLKEMSHKEFAKFLLSSVKKYG